MVTDATKFDNSYLDMDHTSFRDDEFWRAIPAWKDVTRDQFMDHTWQVKNLF